MKSSPNSFSLLILGKSNKGEESNIYGASTLYEASFRVRLEPEFKLCCLTPKPIDNTLLYDGVELYNIDNIITHYQELCLNQT